MWTIIIFFLGIVPFCVGFFYAVALIGCMFFGWDKSHLDVFQGV